MFSSRLKGDLYLQIHGLQPHLTTLDMTTILDEFKVVCKIIIQKGSVVGFILRTRLALWKVVLQALDACIMQDCKSCWFRTSFSVASYLQQVFLCIPIKDVIKNSQFNGALGVNHDDYSSILLDCALSRMRDPRAELFHQQNIFKGGQNWHQMPF